MVYINLDTIARQRLGNVKVPKREQSGNWRVKQLTGTGRCEWRRILHDTWVCTVRVLTHTLTLSELMMEVP